jgi:beta-glucanase (GH16 family)
MESTDGERRRISVAVHYEDPARPGRDNYELRWVEIDATQWHVYQVEWTPAHVAFAVDGREVYRTTDPRHTTAHPMTASAAMFVGTTQTANWIPLPDRTTPDRVVLHIDWIRVSRWIPGGEAR